MSGDRLERIWPPPGTTTRQLAFPEPWEIVYGTPPGETGDWYVTDLATVTGISDEARLVAAYGARFAGPLTAAFLTVGRWPVIYEVGKVNAMQWIHSVLRGNLGLTEQFQHQMNWGLPGNDPDFDAGELLAFATMLAAHWKTVFTDPSNFPTVYTPGVEYAEVGCSQQTQTAATNADGTGGNLATSEAQWYVWPSASERPKGTASGNALPYEVANALTLQTDLRGASGRGRIYLPPMWVGAMAADGKFNEGTTAYGATAVGQWFELVKADTTLVPLVVSRRKLVLNEITSLLYGVVPDSQRRRRRSQDERRTVGWTKP